MMSRSSWLAAAFALGALPLAAAAQQGTPPTPPPARNRSHPGMAGPVRARTMVLRRHSRLGVKVNLKPQESDSIGAYIEAVTPGSPAATAGLQAGDVITKLDGTSLVTSARRRTGESSAPGLRLVELAARLEPNDTISVEVRRGQETKTVSLVTTDEPADFTMGGVNGEDFAIEGGPGEGTPMPGMRMPGGAMGAFEKWRMELPRMEFFFNSPLADVELAPLNAELGQYFGTREGVLVINVPKSSTIGLKGGDVVQAVDGRRIASPSQLLRILRSYDAGESFKLEILRNRRRETVTGQLPQQGRPKARERSGRGESADTGERS